MRRRAYVLSILLVVAMGSMAQAVLITHNTAGQLFSDNFEGYPGGTNPSSPWNITRGAGSVIVDYGAPYAYQGSKFLSVWQTPDSAVKLFADFTSQQQTSGIITTSMALYIPSNWPAYACTIQLQPDTTDATLAAGIIILQSGEVKYYNAGWNVTGLALAVDEWQEMTMTYNLDTDAFTLNVEGQTATVTGSGLTQTVGAIFFSPAVNGGTFYMDAVPEPVTLVLLGLGSMLLRRKVA